MSRYLIDTDVLIDYSKGREPAVARLQQLIDQEEELGVCAVNAGEFFAGVPPDDVAYWRQVFATLTYWHISLAAAEQAGRWRYEFARQGVALTISDALIAAVAQEQTATLITNNARHYPMPGIRLEVLR
jgi:predicted nucleic acid-binding protein